MNNKRKIYSVYDSKAEAYGVPFFQRSRGEATRSWITIANDATEDNAIYRHAEDFTLFEIGEFDEHTGHLHPYATPVSIGVAREFKKDVSNGNSQSHPRSLVRTDASDAGSATR